MEVPFVFVHCMILGLIKNLVLPLPEPPTTSTFLFRALRGSFGRLLMVRLSVFVRITLFHGSGSINGAISECVPQRAEPYKVTRLGTPYAAPVWLCSTFNYRGKAYCASKQIPEDILKELIHSVLSTVYTEGSVHHIEMHPGNRVLFVFQDGHTEERFWKDHSRKDSWDAERRQKAAEKTRIQHQKRKEQEQ